MEDCRKLAREAASTRTLAIGWMLGTFAAFLLLGDTSDLPAPLLLFLYVSLASGAWAAGYRWGIRSFPWHTAANNYTRHGKDWFANLGLARKWIVASGIYFVAYGFLMLQSYGATPQSFWKAIAEPGESYAAKFEIVEDLSQQSGQTLLQVLILLSVFQLALAPLTTYFWSSLGTTLRVLALVGASVYVAFFLYIGTMQGIGYLLAGVLSGILARDSTTNETTTPKRGQRKRRWMFAVLTISAFSLYMINAQSARLETFEVRDKFQPNPLVESFAGRDFARGAAVLVHYPTHGYRGLAYNLETPFAWTMGRGSSRALDSYWAQYLGESVLRDTYPLRTQERTGWLGLQSWATVYPWLASDMSFPGTLFLMIFLGRWTARMWVRSSKFHDPLALMLFSQLILFVIFIPANNQVLISRPAFIGVASCVFLYLAREIAWNSELTRAHAFAKRH